MFTNINLKEAAVFARIMNNGYHDENGKFVKPTPKENILEEIELIDNMLSIMKSASLLNKKRNVKKMLDGILAISVGDDSVVPGSSNLHLMPA
jgi:hypothetical protein